MEITFTVPNDKINRIIDAMKNIYPIPKVHTGFDDDENPIFEPEFTDSQWAKEAVRRFIITTVQKYERQKAIDAINITSDNDLVS